MKILLIDNYDSFTYNLFHLLRGACGTGDSVDIVPNDRLEGVDVAQYERVVISPGPGIPDEAGDLVGFIRHNAGNIPMLGVCLGHQAIAEVFGAHLLNTDTVHHGVCSKIKVDNETCLFRGLPKWVEVGRYHSWVVDDCCFPDCLMVTARTEQGEIMAVEHCQYPVYGVQFHPESIMTPSGLDMVANFLKG